MVTSITCVSCAVHFFVTVFSQNCRICSQVKLKSCQLHTYEASMSRLLCYLDELLVLHIFLLMIILYNSRLKDIFPLPHLPTRFYFISFGFECFYFLTPLSLLRFWKLNPVTLLLALNGEYKLGGVQAA